MTERVKFQAIKGTRDILPPDSALWNRVEQTARDVFATYGYGEIRTPIFEQTELFARSIGADTDVVSKEMYTFDEMPEPDDPAILRAFLESVVEHARASGKSKVAQDFSQLLARSDERPLNVGNFLSPPTDEDPAVNAALIQIGRAYIEWVGQRGITRLTLRPEATASVCRAYAEHGMQTLPGNVKLYYMGPMFRRERPQKGRYRQFYQIGAEVLGPSDAPAIDAELIEMLLVFFDRAGLKGTSLAINSIGCRECRPKYMELLRDELRKVTEQLGADSQRRVETNPLRVLDSKLPQEQPIIEKLPRIADHLCENCRVHFAKLQQELGLRGIAYEINWRLVRGLDYYMRTTFEIIAPGLGSQNAVCGGGRYDGLVELLGGPPAKGIGFAIGTDRVILSLQEAAKAATGANARANAVANAATGVSGLDVFVAWMGERSYAPAVHLTRKLREAGLAVELPPEELKFKKSLGLADKLGARYALIIGEDEVASGEYTLKHLADSSQKKYPEPSLIAHLAAEKRK